MSRHIFTVGHSNHSLGHFIDLLKARGVTMVADVRSHPYSRYAPQYCKSPLEKALAGARFVYVFLGKELGGRSDDPACYRDGRIQYDRLSVTPAFGAGIERLVEAEDAIAVMCSEKDPINCHRALLIAPKLAQAGIVVSHILADGSLETHEQFETRLLEVCGLWEEDLFRSREELIAEAYSTWSAKVAYYSKEMDDSSDA